MAIVCNDKWTQDMYRLSTSNRCNLFELIAENVWDSITYNHRAKVQASELGITNGIVSVVRTHQSLNHNFGVWSNPGVDEAVNGGDIDIFIETETDQFLWYALQAKVLKKEGRYDGLISKRQWDKLSNLQKQLKCIPFFLFYNGIDKKPETFKDCCGHEINEKQFGCTIVEIGKVKNIAILKSNPRYSDFNPEYGHPWRELVCCTAKRKNGTSFSLRQVQEAVSSYEGLVNSEVIYRGNNNEIGREGITIIKDSNENVGRNPTHTFAIRTNAGMNQ